MKLKPPNEKTPQGLDGCLRQPVAHYDAARRTIRTTRTGLYFADLATDSRSLLSRQCDPEMREVDEALLRGMKAQPGFAKEAQVPADLFENTFLLESAGAQLERSSTDLLGSLVDCTLTLRLGLHDMNGKVEGTVVLLSQDPQTPWWQGQKYHAQWTEVGLLERMPIDRSLGKRGLRDSLDKSAADEVDRLNLSEEDLANLALLDSVVHGPPATPQAALPAKKLHGKAVAPPPARTGRKGPTGPRAKGQGKTKSKTTTTTTKNQ